MPEDLSHCGFLRTATETVVLWVFLQWWSSRHVGGVFLYIGHGPGRPATGVLTASWPDMAHGHGLDCACGYDLRAALGLGAGAGHAGAAKRWINSGIAHDYEVEESRFITWWV